MSDSHAQTINYHDSEKFREPKAAFLGIVAFKESLEEEESRKNTEKERPERSELKWEKVTSQNRERKHFQKGANRYYRVIIYKKNRNMSCWIWHFEVIVD